MAKTKKLFHNLQIQAGCFLITLVLLACNNTSESNSQNGNADSASTPSKEKQAKSIATITKNDSTSIWIYDYATSTPIKNQEAKPELLTPQKIIEFINSNNSSVHLDLRKISNDTIFVKIKESTFLTQQMGSTGADEYMSVTTFTLTELKGMKYVNYDFEEGDHANPGTYSRKYYLERNN
ncbi:MAG: hypothetical protein IPP64_12520 [Bacteroidetes bacterium]|nr:hypothetical protein [Bacteroidota bacterium]